MLDDIPGVVIAPWVCFLALAYRTEGSLGTVSESHLAQSEIVERSS
jgi:hypothetical protein